MKTTIQFRCLNCSAVIDGDSVQPESASMENSMNYAITAYLNNPYSSLYKPRVHVCSETSAGVAVFFRISRQESGDVADG
jgi:hypothetical protein